MPAPKIDEQDDRKAEYDYDDRPEDGDIHIAAHPFEVDGDRDGLRDADIVSRKKQRGAELAECTGKCEHSSGCDRAPRQRDHQLEKDARIRPTERAGRIEHVRIKVLKRTAT